MNKKVIATIVLTLILSLVIWNTISADLNSNVDIKISNAILKEKEETTITLSYTGTNTKVNTIKGQIEYDNNVFEDIKESDIKLLNGWTQLEYNAETKEFIAIKKNNAKPNEYILQITLKSKDNINNINESTIRIKNISMSNGTENIVETEKSLLMKKEQINNENISNNESTNTTINDQKQDEDKTKNSKESNKQEQNSNVNNQKSNSQSINNKESNNQINTNAAENISNNKNTKIQPNSSSKKDTSTANGNLPKAGTEKINKYILLSIVIFTIIAIILGIKCLKIDKKIITKNTALIITTIVVASTILIPFTSTKATEEENKEIIKGQLNNDEVIDYEDVRILEKYLINKTTLAEFQTQNADINDDTKIDIMDLSLLINKLEEHNGSIKIEKKSEEKAYRETTSMYSWGDTTLVKGEEAQDVYKTLKDLNVTTLYQSMHRSKMTKDYLADIIKGYHNQGIEVYRLSGDPSWVYDNSDAKGDIDEIVAYNATVDEDARLVGINLDVEPHGNKTEWKENPQAVFTQYVKSMIDIYNYAKQYDIQVTICVNDWMPNYEGVDDLFKNAADTYSVMNYVRNRMFKETKIGAEIKLAEKYNKKIESISNVMQSEPDSESYYNDGMEKLLEDQKTLMNKYSYKNLRTSFHYYKPIKEVIDREKAK